MVKLFAMGFIFERGSYLRDAWNWLDFTVVITGLIEFSGLLPGVSFLKLFRILRPLRAVNRIKKLKARV